MTTALDVVLLFLILVVGVWVVVFGSIGVLVAPRADFGRLTGFSLGVLTGPIGVGWMLWRGRGSDASASPDAGPDDVVDDSIGLM